jgi:RNA polymerase sigma-70 factor (ECF subfamily)
MSDAVVAWLFGRWDGGEVTGRGSAAGARRLHNGALHDQPSLASTESIEPALASRLRAGDETALRAVMDTYYHEIVSLALSYVRSEDQARDLAQDAFIRLWQHRSALRPEQGVGAYLRTAVRNAARDVLRHERQQRRLASAITFELEFAKRVDVPAGVTAVELEALERQVRAVFMRLSPRLREIAGLYFERGFSPPEIGDILGISVTTVYPQLRKIFRALTVAFERGDLDIDHNPE